MIVRDLINKKDYDYIEWYMTLPEDFGKSNIFFGISKSINGELISLDGDSYSEDETVVSYNEWSDDELGIKNGLAIIVETEWIGGEADE